MNTIYKKIELVANIAIIVVALLLAAVLARRYFAPNSSSGQTSAQSRIQPGTRISLSNVDWTRSERTLLLVVQKGCHFCTESAPFYQRLVREIAGRRNIQLVAVLPQNVDEGRQYLKELGVEVTDVKQAAPGSLGVTGTPTLILVNSSGLVTKSWVGRLPAEGEADVLGQLGI